MSGIGAPTVVRGPLNTTFTSQVGGTALENLHLRYFADFAKYLEPDEAPFTASLKTGKAVNTRKVEMGQKHMLPHTALLGGSGATNNGGVTGLQTITFAAGETAKLMRSQVLSIGVERMYVVDFPGANTVQVIRGFQGTTPVAHAAAAVVDLEAPAALENVPTPLAPVAKGSTDYNLCQTMDLGVWVSDLEDVTPDYEVPSGSKYDYYLSQKMKEMRILFEKTAINGIRAGGPDVFDATGTNALPHTMGGLDYFTDITFDLQGMPLTEYVFLNMLHQSWLRVGADNMPKKLYVNGFMKMAISSIWNNNRWADVKDTETNLVWRRVQTDFGPIEFVMSRYIRPGRGYLVDLGDITIHPYKSHAWHDKRLPEDGPYKKGRFTGTYTIMFKRAAARSKFINASTNPADYPNL